MTEVPRVVVVGGGITGLTAAYAVVRARPDIAVTLLEAKDRLGGNIVTERHDGFVIDGGPDSFLRTKPDAVALCRELGLGGELITTSERGRKVYFVHEGALEEMPGGMALAVPTRLGPLLSTPLLSTRGKLRAAIEPVIPRHRGGDESIEAFIGRRLGPDAARSLAAPLLGGIYAGDIDKLSIRATFPQLVALEEKHGSLVRGLFEAARAESEQAKMGLLSWLMREAKSVPSPFNSLRNGMGTLIDALARSLPDGAVRTGEPVVGLRQAENRWAVETKTGERLLADAVILAAPAHAAARAVPDEELAEELSGIPYLSTATVFFAFDQKDVEHRLDAVGFVAPKGEAEILAATWVSSKWDGRAPEGRVLMRAFVGGSRSPSRVRDASDEDLVADSKSELERLMGRLGTPLFTRVFRYENANPQPIVGHRDRLARIESHLGKLRGLFVAGAAFDGVGIPDCVRQGRAVADRVTLLLR